MDFLRQVLDYITKNIIAQPPILLGLIACVGLIVQRKGPSDVIKGTLKTIIGVVILFKAVNIISASLAPLSEAFARLYDLPVNGNFDPSIWGTFLGDYGTSVALVMIFAFILNLVIARLTPLKNIFLTGHIFFWMSFISVAVSYEAGLEGTGLIVFSTILLTAYIVIFPALMRPLVRKVTGSDDFTIGHTASIHAFIGAGVGKLTSRFGESKSTEDIELPKGLEFFKETTITTSIIIIITYLTVGLIIGKEASTEIFGAHLGSVAAIPLMQYELVSFSLMAGLTFGAGLTILLTGVRMMLAEIVPAFKGISDKLIPNSVPALDIPMVFPFAPNALTLGFLISMVTSIITLVVMAATGTMVYALIPLVVACFFDVAPGAIFANAYGGRVAVVISSIISGIVMMILVTLAIPALINSAAGFNQIFGGNDFSLWAIIADLISKFLQLFM